MERKGSITVFLALILSLITALVCTSVESVRMAAARTQILSSVDIGLYSLFGQYDKTLLEDYDLFLLDGSCGKGALDLASVYDNFKSYMVPVLKQNSQKLSVQQGGFTGYCLVTDNNGEPFYQQVVRYMQETLGIHGVSLLLDRINGRKESTLESEKIGEKAQNGDTLSSYDSQMQEASRKSTEKAKEEAEKKKQEDELGDGTSDVITAPAPKVVNPITVIRKIQKMGILSLVIPGGHTVSEASASSDAILSRREKEQGMPMYDLPQADSSLTSQVLFQQYLMEKLGNYAQPAKEGLKYQIEYILEKGLSDLENLKGIAKRLLIIREGVNFAALLADGVKRAQAESLALAIASTFLVPPAAAIIEGALLLCWAFGESILDLRELFDGGRVPLVKNAAQWQLSLENLPYLLDGLDSVRKGTQDGMSYEDYLQVLLLAESKENKVIRGMDMVEHTIRNLGRQNFRLDQCITAAEVSVDVKANKRKVFTVTRDYSYD